MTKSMCIIWVLAAIKTSEPISLLSELMIWTSCGLKSAAARCSSTEHSPFLLLIASSAGTHPSGPVPVTSTRRAPNSYSLCITKTKRKLLDHHSLNFDTFSSAGKFSFKMRSGSRTRHVFLFYYSRIYVFRTKMENAFWVFM